MTNRKINVWVVMNVVFPGISNVRFDGGKGGIFLATVVSTSCKKKIAEKFKGEKGILFAFSPTFRYGSSLWVHNSF